MRTKASSSDNKSNRDAIQTVNEEKKKIAIARAELDLKEKALAKAESAQIEDAYNRGKTEAVALYKEAEAKANIKATADLKALALKSAERDRERDAALAELDTLKNQQKNLQAKQAKASADNKKSFSSLSESQLAAENKIRELNGALAAAKIHEEEVVARTIRELKEKDMAELIAKQKESNSKLSATEKVSPSPSLGLKGLFLYTGGVLFRVEWCIRQP